MLCRDLSSTVRKTTLYQEASLSIMININSNKETVSKVLISRVSEVYTAFCNK